MNHGNQSIPPAQDRGRVRLGWVWFGLLGGAAAWSLHFLFSYFLAESSCVTALRRLELLGMSGTMVLILAVSVLAALLALAAALTGLGTWRRWHGEEPSGGAFAGLAGLLLSSIFLFIIVVDSLPVLFLGTCSR